MGRSSLVFLLGVLLLAACSDGGGDDDGSPNGSAGGGGKSGKPGTQIEPTRRVMLSTVTGVRLQFGAELQFRGRLLDMEAKPIEDGVVSFALVGESQDSSLLAIDVRSDKSGTFENALTAGEQPASYRVRVSSHDAADVFVDVSVSAAGFGSLLVTAQYDGARAVDQRSVFVRAKGKCDGSERVEGDRFATLSQDQSQVRLPALPVDVPYAVTVLAQSATGVVARGCVEGVTLAPDTELPLDVPFVDMPLDRSGMFALAANLDTSGPASALAVAMSTAVDALVIDSDPGQPAPPDAEARFLLDTLDATLHIAQAPQKWLDLAQALEFDRENNAVDEPTPDHLLQGVLEIDDRGPLAAVAEMTQPTQDGLEHIRLTSALSLLAKGKTPASWQPQRIEAVRPDDGDASNDDDLDPISIDLRSDTNAKITAEFMPDRDVLDVSRMSFHAQLGALATQVLHGVLSDEADGGHLAAVRDALGCDLVSTWLDGQGYVGACDTDCIQTFCEAAIAGLQAAAEGALSDLDVSRPAITLEGELELIDRDGDLVIEAMRCRDLSGAWPAARSGARADSITGTAVATSSVGTGE